jgi:hypothetical protein
MRQPEERRHILCATTIDVAPVTIVLGILQHPHVWLCKGPKAAWEQPLNLCCIEIGFIQSNR